MEYDLIRRIQAPQSRRMYGFLESTYAISGTSKHSVNVLMAYADPNLVIWESVDMHATQLW